MTCHSKYTASAERLTIALTGLFDAAKKQWDVASDIPTELPVHTTIGRMREPELDPIVAAGRVQPEEMGESLVQIFLGGVVTD